jgi:hypothetical protein
VDANAFLGLLCAVGLLWLPFLLSDVGRGRRRGSHSGYLSPRGTGKPSDEDDDEDDSLFLGRLR